MTVRHLIAWLVQWHRDRRNRDRDLVAILAAQHPSWVRGRALANLYSGKHRRISYGTLYVRMRRLVEDGCVEQKEAEDEHGRLRLFRVTARGAACYRVLVRGQRK